MVPEGREVGRGHIPGRNLTWDHANKSLHCKQNLQRKTRNNKLMISGKEQKTSRSSLMISGETRRMSRISLSHPKVTMLLTLNRIRLVPLVRLRSLVRFVGCTIISLKTTKD